MLCTCCTSGYSHLYIGSGGVGKIGEFFHSDLKLWLWSIWSCSHLLPWWIIFYLPVF